MNLFPFQWTPFQIQCSQNQSQHYLYKSMATAKYSILGYQLYVMEAKDFVVLNNALTYKVQPFDHRFKIGCQDNLRPSI